MSDIPLCACWKGTFCYETGNDPENVLLPAVLGLAACNTVSTSTNSAAPAQAASITDTAIPNPPAVSSLERNELLSFFHAWYATFDGREPWENIRPLLPDGEVNFVYPAGTFTSIEALEQYAIQSRSVITDSAHELGGVSVNRTADPNVFELVAPHRYLLQTADGQAFVANLVGKMQVQRGLATAADPAGEMLKIVGYTVLANGGRDVIEPGLITANRVGDLNESDVKSFVFEWFANLDEADAEGVMNMTSDGPLNIDLLGQRFSDKAGFRQYLVAQSGVQEWAEHTPHNITVTANGDGFDVSFLVAFEGAIPGMGVLYLNNLTRWRLIEEDGELRLSDYSLELL